MPETVNGKYGKVNTWVIGILVSVMVSMGSFFAGNMTASGQVEKVKCELEQVKIEINTLKTILPEVREDIGEIKTTLQKMNERMDRTSRRTQ